MRRKEQLVTGRTERVKERQDLWFPNVVVAFIGHQTQHRVEI
jgi:hypothetical protein